MQFIQRLHHADGNCGQEVAEHIRREDMYEDRA